MRCVQLSEMFEATRKQKQTFRLFMTFFSRDGREYTQTNFKLSIGTIKLSTNANEFFCMLVPNKNMAMFSGLISDLFI